MRYGDRKFSGSQGDAETLEYLLERAIESAGLEGCSAVDEKTKEQLRLHHNSWIINPLKQALKFVRGEVSRNDAKHDW